MWRSDGQFLQGAWLLPHLLRPLGTISTLNWPSKPCCPTSNRVKPAYALYNITIESAIAATLHFNKLNIPKLNPTE